MMYKRNMSATQQANKHYLQIQFDSDPMSITMYVANGIGRYARIEPIQSTEQVHNLLRGAIYMDGPNNDLYLYLSVDNRVVIDANFKNMNQVQFSEKALECANEIKQAISNRNLNQQARP